MHRGQMGTVRGCHPTNNRQNAKRASTDLYDNAGERRQKTGPDLNFEWAIVAVKVLSRVVPERGFAATFNLASHPKTESSGPNKKHPQEIA